MTDSDADRQTLQEQSIREIAAGGLPVEATRRLEGVAAARSQKGFCFTSDLTVGEFAMLRQHHIRPITQVMGSSVFNMGTSIRQSSLRVSQPDRELDGPTQAYNRARELAVGRLQQEAALAGADSVAGVRIEAGRCEWGHSLVEFRALGTAVECPSLRVGDTASVTNLSGQDVAALLGAGWAPVGLVGATSVYFGAMSVDRAYEYRQMWIGRKTQNYEMTDFVDAWWQARNRAMHRVRVQATELGAHGIVGFTWQQHSEEMSVTWQRPQWGGNSWSTGRNSYSQDGWPSSTLNEIEAPGVVYTVHVLATAIVELEGAESPPIYTMMPLSPRSSE